MFWSFVGVVLLFGLALACIYGITRFHHVLARLPLLLGAVAFSALATVAYGNTVTSMSMKWQYGLFIFLAVIAFSMFVGSFLYATLSARRITETTGEGDDAVTTETDVWENDGWYRWAMILSSLAILGLGLYLSSGLWWKTEWNQWFSSEPLAQPTATAPKIEPKSPELKRMLAEMEKAGNRFNVERSEDFFAFSIPGDLIPEVCEEREKIKEDVNERIRKDDKRRIVKLIDAVTYETSKDGDRITGMIVSYRRKLLEVDKDGNATDKEMQGEPVECTVYLPLKEKEWTADKCKATFVKMAESVRQINRQEELTRISGKMPRSRDGFSGAEVPIDAELRKPPKK